MHCTGDAAVEVQVARLDVALPIGLRLFVERLQAAGQSVVQAVDQRDRLFERVERCHGQQRCEELGAEGERLRLHPHFDGGAQDVFLLVHKFGRDEPCFAGFQQEGLLQLLVLVGDHRADDVARVPHAAHFER